MCMMFSQYNTCSMVLYLTIQYQSECGHIEGHAYPVFSPLAKALYGLMIKYLSCSLGLQAFSKFLYNEKFNWEARKNEIGRQGKMKTRKHGEGLGNDLSKV